MLSGSAPQRLQLTFEQPATTTANVSVASVASVVSVGGSVSGGCDFVDMDDGGLWTRGAHPIDQSDHAWLRATTAWLVRAATVTFTADGTRHLTPGYPTHYNGQWMRDGYYGIAHAWDVANATHRTAVGD